MLVGGSMVVCCSRRCVISFPGASHIACVLVFIFVSGTLAFAELVMGWFVSFVKSDITGGNSEFAFCKFSGDIFAGRFGTGVYGAGTFTRAFLSVGDISLDSLS